MLEVDVCTKDEVTATWVTVVVHVWSQTGLNVDFRIIALIFGDDEEVRGADIEAQLRQTGFLNSK